MLLLANIFYQILLPTTLQSYHHIIVNPYDLSGGYHSLFVYCNVVQPSYVGDSFTQLLRIIEIPSEKRYGDQVHLHYPSPYYIPLLTQEFETIEIDIKAETGESEPFEFGRSIVTLHFRRKSL